MISCPVAKAALRHCRLQEPCCSCCRRLRSARPVFPVRGSAAHDGGSLCARTGFLLALLTQRCFFVDFSVFHSFFTHELDFSREHHQDRLVAVGHDVSSHTYMLEHSGAGYAAFAEVWMFQDFRNSLAAWQEVVLLDDLDYSAALLLSNPHYQVTKTDIAPPCHVSTTSCAFLLHIPVFTRACVIGFPPGHWV